MEDDSLKKMLWYELGHLSAQLYLVKRDVQPIAEISALLCNKRELIKDIKREGLKYICDPNGENHVDIYIYKYPHLKKVIQCHLNSKYDDPIFEIWLAGKMFGYSEAAISEFLQK